MPPFFQHHYGRFTRGYVLMVDAFTVERSHPIRPNRRYMHFRIIVLNELSERKLRIAGILNTPVAGSTGIL